MFKRTVNHSSRIQENPSLAIVEGAMSGGGTSAGRGIKESRARARGRAGLKGCRNHADERVLSGGKRRTMNVRKNEKKIHEA